MDSVEVEVLAALPLSLACPNRAATPRPTIMVSISYISLALMAFSSLSKAQVQECGGQQYDPTQSVCHFGAILCPIQAGEPLSHCGGACYSTFLYTCKENVLVELPVVGGGLVYTLTAHNPTSPIHGLPVSACANSLSINGSTCSIPAGDVTAMNGEAEMAVTVRCGQRFGLDENWNVRYTKPGVSCGPRGNGRNMLRAYHDGGLMNLYGDALGWMACPARASGRVGPTWSLVGRNASNADYVKGCTPVNLKVHLGGAIVEQYT